jgi:hypothetical protein
MTIYKILYTTTFGPEVSVMKEFTSLQEAEKQLILLTEWLDLTQERIWIVAETL